MSDFDETMNENLGEQAEMDDASIEEVVEEQEEDSSIPLDSFIEEEAGEAEEPAADQPEEQPEEPKAKEPGYVKGRIAKAVQQARAEMQADFDKQIAAMKAQFDEQMAPIRERMIEDQAQELVRTRKVADIEMAREYVRMKQGSIPKPVPQQKEEAPAPQPAQQNNQPAQQNPGTSVWLSRLERQAAQIKADTGIDVTAEFMRNPEVKQKVIAGEMDFNDVLKQMQQSKKRPPSPIRTPNGATGHNPNAFENMTSEQFRKMESKIVNEGVRYDLS